MSTVPDPDSEPRRLWWTGWPREWLRDESFWRDIVTRTVSGLIIAFIIWGVGIAVGVFQNPAAIEGFIIVLQFLILVPAIGSLFLEIPLALGRHVIKDGPPRTIWWFSIVATVFLIVAITWNLISTIFFGVVLF